MTRRIRYQVACSLDGYIAGPDGEFDWIVADPDIDFAALWAQYDTLLMGRKTFAAMPEGDGTPGISVYVFSNSLEQEKVRNATVVRSDDIAATIKQIRAKPGKDIWLYGGGELFRTLWDLGEVDTVEPAIVPILLGDGVPFLPTPAQRRKLELRSHRLYKKSGIVLLEYDVRK